MIAQQKIFRVFRLIRLLNQRPYKTVLQLAVSLEIDARSVYRYLKLLEEIGYLIDKDDRDRYFLFEPVKDGKEANFGPEETQLLRELVERTAANHPLQESILRKLYIHSELLPLADTLLKVQQAKVIASLSEAIRDRKQVVLHQYHSANSDTFSDRLVEPLQFTENFNLLLAYEPVSTTVKTFKVERIDRISIQAQDQTYGLPVSAPDLFGMVGLAKLPVVLRLNSRAYRLLLEEYPQAKPFTKKEGSGYLFTSTVQDVRGVGRFVLGLAGEVDVLEPKELKEYLNDRIRRIEF